ncbi:MAG: HD-GYP domain-containing protein [Actinomycetales bacterium]
MTGRSLRDSTAVAFLVLLAAASSLTSIVLVAQRGVAQPLVALVFGLVIAAGEVVRVTLPGNRDAAPLSSAASLAYATLPAFAGGPASHTASQVVAVTTAGVAVGMLPHVIARRAPALDVPARRLLVVTLAALATRETPLLDFARELPPWARALALVIVIIAMLVVEAVLAAMVRASDEHRPFGATAVDELRSAAGIGSAIGSTAVLLSLSADVMSYWAFPVLTVPLLLTQFAFRRFAGIRATYLQTIRSLARITEVGGYTETGHAARVAALALAVGRDLGLSESQLLDLEYAALMHDIGQLSLVEPIPGGTTVVTAAPEQRRIANNGAAIIRQTGVLDRVAHIVERQSEPYRRIHQGSDPDVPVESRIIRVANAFDDLVGESGGHTERLQALERLRLSVAFDYDPLVVESLAHVVDRAEERRDPIVLAPTR